MRVAPTLVLASLLTNPSRPEVRGDGCSAPGSPF